MRILLAVLALLVCVSSIGCVQRTITITSQPSGALVHLNDVEVGRTPLTVPFKFYGTYDVRLERDGYEPLWTAQEADAPWWEAPGPDLIAEAIPDAESSLHWHYDLTPAPAPEDVDADRLLEHARQMRAASPGAREGQPIP